MSAPTERGDTADERDRLLQDAGTAREELAHSVDGLVARTDVKARARDKASELRAHGREKVTRTAGTTRRAASRLGGQVGDAVRRNPVPLAAAGAAVLVGAVVATRHTRISKGSRR